MSERDDRRPPSPLLASVRRVRRRLHAVRFAEAAVLPLWAAATACVLARLALREVYLWAVPPLVLAAGAWWVLRARARRVSLAHAAVLADRSVGAGGLLLTGLERPAGEWEPTALAYARAVKPPTVAWKRPVGALLAALLFLVCGLRLPLPAPSVRSVNAAALAKVDAVRAQAEALAREVPPGASLEEELRRLSAEAAEGRFDATDWEAADRLQQSLSEKAARAAAELAAASEAARELESALDAASGAEAAAREREALEKALLKLGADAAKPGSSPGADSQAPRSRQEAAALREALERRQRELAQRFGEGSGPPGSGAGKGRSGKEGQGEGEGEGQGRSDARAGRPSKPGQGGVGRGGESQPLVFGEKAEMDPERLAFQPLPPGQGGEAGALWGLRAAEPPRPERTPASGARGTGARGDGEAGHSAGPLLPRNRELVKRYFGEQP